MKPTTEAEGSAAVRRNAAHRKAYFEKHHDLSADQVVGLSKWLNASLLATNGAAVIAVLNNAQHIKVSIVAMTFFIAGLLLPMASAWFLQVIYSNVTEPIFNYFLYWSEVETSGERDEAAEENLKFALLHAYRFQYVPPALGWLSALAFVGGIVATMRGLG